VGEPKNHVRTSAARTIIFQPAPFSLMHFGSHNIGEFENDETLVASSFRLVPTEVYL
jgi:hypothetical protein